MASAIELECPSCQENLELDAGFAGGVCRCFNCGTLMTVPADAQQRPEKLIRPERPGGAARRKTARPSRPDRPSAPVAPATPAPPKPAASGRPARPDSPGKRPAAPVPPPPPPPPEPEDDEPVEEEAADDGVYQTESGRTVRVDTRRGIPTATKRRVARLATYAIFGLVTLLIVGMCVAAILVLLNQEPPPSKRAIPVETFTYDPAVNPLTLDKPNALGLPLRQRSVIVVDASDSSSAWLADANAALKAGLTRAGGSEVEVIYAAAAGPQALFSRTRPLADVTAGSLAALQAKVPVSGTASLVDAAKQAAAADPTHIVLITSQRPTDDETTRLRGAVGDKPDLVFDAVAVGRESVALDDLTKAFSGLGRYTRLSADQLASWRAEAAGAP